MKRVIPAGYVSLGAAGTQQPVFGVKLTAALGAPGAGSNLVTVTVSATGIFMQGDWVTLDPLNSTVDKREQVIVASVTDGTRLVLQGTRYAHANGVWLQLAMPCQKVYVQAKPGNTGAILIGAQGVVYSTGAYGIKDLEQSAAGTIPADFTDSIETATNGMSTGYYWFDGATTGDKILASATVL